MNTCLVHFLREIENSGFYGSVELKFEDGRLTIVRKSETIKLDPDQPNCRDNRGNNAVEHRN